jgi:hypothetical protein
MKLVMIAAIAADLAIASTGAEAKGCLKVLQSAPLPVTQLGTG